MSDANKIVAAILAGLKVSAAGNDKAASAYIAEYDSIRNYLDSRDATAQVSREPATGSSAASGATISS